MHFYITNKNTKNLQLISDALERNFENIIVGRSTDAQRAFDDLRQLRVDVLVVDYDLAPFDGLALLRRLKQANILPRVIMTANTPSESLITAAYQNGCDFFIHHQLNSEEIAHISKIISTTLQLLSNMRVISELSGSLNNPYGRQQTTHHQQIDHVTDTLRFLGIASEKGYEDIMKIIRLMVVKDMSFDQIDLEESFGINSREKKSSTSGSAGPCTSGSSTWPPCASTTRTTKCCWTMPTTSLNTRTSTWKCSTKTARSWSGGRFPCSTFLTASFRKATGSSGTATMSSGKELSACSTIG